MKKIFRHIHLWLSVPFGLVVSVICFSGAVLVFEEEITDRMHRDLHCVKEVKAAPLPLDKLLEKAAAALPDSVHVTGVTLSSRPEHAYRVSLSKPHRASLYLDQYTGEIKGRRERPAFFLTMFRLHRWLMDVRKPGEGIFWGKMIVGVSTLLFVFVLISGIVVWWPRRKAAWKSRLQIAVRSGKARFWYDSHAVGGMYAFLFLLAMALTGLTWSFDRYRSGFYQLFGAEAGRGGGHKTAAPVAQRVDGNPPYVCWRQVCDRLIEKNPGYKQISLSAGSASVSFSGLGNTRAADRYKFHPQTGEIVETVLYKDADKSGKIRGWIYSVHVGSWGGAVTRVLAFAAALTGATLPLTGYYFWIKRLWRKRRRRG